MFGWIALHAFKIFCLLLVECKTVQVGMHTIFMHVYLQVICIEFSGSYSQVSVFRISAVPPITESAFQPNNPMWYRAVNGSSAYPASEIICLSKHLKL